MAEPLRIVVASANPDKVVEIRAILSESLGDRVELVARPTSVPDVVEDGRTLLDNARLKALALVRATGETAVADDTGLEVTVLGGDPGVYSARYAGEHASYEDNVTKLLGALEGSADRSARFRTVAVAAFPDGGEIACEGSVDGVIAHSPAGENGFGYDPVFVPDGANGATFAQMTASEKEAVSHRGRAFRSLGALLAARADAAARRQ